MVIDYGDQDEEVEPKRANEVVIWPGAVENDQPNLGEHCGDDRQRPPPVCRNQRSPETKGCEDEANRRQRPDHPSG